MDRTINFGDDEADARYRIQDTSSTGGDFVLAEDLDGGTVLLEYDYSASEWVSRGPVNLNGNDITNAGSVSADALEANKAEIGKSYQETRKFNYNNTGGYEGIFSVDSISSGMAMVGLADNSSGANREGLFIVYWSSWASGFEGIVEEKINDPNNGFDVRWDGTALQWNPRDGFSDNMYTTVISQGQNVNW